MLLSEQRGFHLIKLHIGDRYAVMRPGRVGGN